MINTQLGPGGLYFVDGAQVGEMREDSVVLTLPASEVERLPRPEENPAVIEHHGAEDAENPLEHKLRRAWEIISGKG